jgi:hypothetical protein
VPTADAVTREAAWLNTASGDSLPFLPASAGGPWNIVDAYVQGAQTRHEAPAIYVTRGKVEQIRVGNQRVRDRYQMRLELRWPVRVISPGSSSIAAQEQQNLDSAVEMLRARITGPLGDKSHGGRFLSAAEVKGMPGIDVTFEPASQTIRQAKEIRAVVSYWIDDFEINA